MDLDIKEVSHCLNISIIKYKCISFIMHIRVGSGLAKVKFSVHIMTLSRSGKQKLLVSKAYRHTVDKVHV